MNPVARRELQERFRSLRSPILLSLWVLAAGAITFLAYLVAQTVAEGRLDNLGSGLGSVLASSSMGRFILQALLIGLMTAVVFVVPGQAAVTIVGERERRTLPLLQVSQLSARGIVFGKLMSSLAYILLLLIATTPLMVIPVLLGGVTIWQVLSGIGMVGAAAVMIGAVAMWVSARARSVQGAVLGSYMWTVAIVFGTLALLVAEVIMLGPQDRGRTTFAGGYERDGGRELYASWLNPYIGLADASSDTLTFQGELVPSPYIPMRAALLERQGFEGSRSLDLYDTYGDFRGRDGFFQAEFGGVIGGFNQQVTQQVRTVDPIRSAVWWKVLIFEAIVTALALYRASRLVRAPRASFHTMKRRRSKEVAAGNA